MKLTSEYLNISPDFSEVIEFSINNIYYGDGVVPLFSFNDSIGKIKCLSDLELKKTEGVLKKYLIKNKKMKHFSHYKDKVREFIEVQNEKHVRHTASKIFQEKFGVTEKSFRFNRSLMEITGITVQKKEQKANWKSIFSKKNFL
ncbi:MAG: hypothetical protein IC227_05035 [Enterococcus lacertideformus]|uniref:Uncharacterized protein n=1 Tax=Enterococcus lacertideformus TaxID=2771493 RepID=A0A931AY17_9ENTE|nr:hypothetical protein [Enterococcus lacertideformus]